MFTSIAHILLPFHIVLPFHIQKKNLLLQERFRSLIPSYIRDSSVAIIVYDITSRNPSLPIHHFIGTAMRKREGLRA